MEPEQTGNGAQQRGLARAVRTEEGDDLSGLHLEADASEYLDGRAVHDLEVAHGEDRPAPIPRGHASRH